MRIAHISDLHFSKLTWGFSQIFSKALVGNFNLLLNRKYDFFPERLYALLPLLREREVTDVIVSGDLSTTSSHRELTLAKAFVDSLRTEGFRTHIIPGNHDRYTRRADKTHRFYRYFPPSPESTPGTDMRHRVTAQKQENGWWFVLMDTALATPPFSATGYFSPAIETRLTHLLDTIPADEPILLVNHFPFLQHDKPKRRLKRGEALCRLLLSRPNIRIYLHGHTHRLRKIDLRASGLPLILDSGSVAYRDGSWYLIDLPENRCTVTSFLWSKGGWAPEKPDRFTWET
ncbi:MAG: metallophosphoesterase [Simkaniaceae bacterium]|nr:metallophosphoesterase [Simkaniaceae bacterium]